MRKYRWFARAAGPVLVFVLLGAGLASAQQSKPAATREPAPNPSPTPEKDLADIQGELIKLLRMSPTLTTVVARDPSLLSNQDYVSHNNPELARFLQAHPEVARNPDFYLFTNMSESNGTPSEALERKVWPELPAEHRSPVLQELISNGVPFLVFVCFLGALLWLTHVVLENRRWGRIFTLQTDVHGKLMDKFGSSQELLSYMNTEVGKRFLEAAPIPVGFERSQLIPSPVARVLTPLQIGVVMTLLGIGFFFLCHSIPDAATPLLILGVVVLMPGLGFIISAGITWALAWQLGLMPPNPKNRD